MCVCVCVCVCVCGCVTVCHLGCHGSNLPGSNGTAHNIIFQTWVLQISEIRHSAPDPLFVLVPCVSKLFEHT